MNIDKLLFDVGFIETNFGLEYKGYQISKVLSWITFYGKNKSFQIFSYNNDVELIAFIGEHFPTEMRKIKIKLLLNENN